MAINQNIKNGILSSAGLRPYSTNAPTGTTAATNYFATDTKAFYAQNLQWSSNMFDIQIQGLDSSDWYAYSDQRVRVSDVISPTTGDYLNDDWAWILFEDPTIDYVPIGAKVLLNNSIWLVVNPDNTASESGSAIIRRCNTEYHFMDYYGNVIAEPMIFDRGKALGTADYYDEEMALMTAYAHCFMQRNDNTASIIRHNTRMLLGHQAYAVRGLVDFSEEFTGDQNSKHMLRFDLGITEPNENDDFNSLVAEGRSFSWVILPQVPDTMPESGSIVLSASSIRCGVEITSTQDHPIAYRWTSSDTSIATVDSSTGILTGVSEGRCEITCALRQNNNVFATHEISVVQDSGNEYVGFTSQPPASLQQFTSVTLRAVRYQGGEELPGEVTFALSGPDSEAYGYTVDEETNTITVTCYAPSAIPLTVTAAYGTETTSAEIRLEGI